MCFCILFVIVNFFYKCYYVYGDTMYDVIVIGAGPAGMMASIVAAKNNSKVLLLERNSMLGKKLLITGGGRCNVTNLKSVNDFLKDIYVNRNFLKYSLNTFGPKEIYNYFIKLGVHLKVEDNDRVFPSSNNSSSIVNALYKELEKYNVEIKYNCLVTDINRSDNGYLIIVNKNCFKTKNIIVATGSKSFPKTGSTGIGYKIAKKLDQPISKIYPSQSPLILNSKLPLSGITLDDVLLKLNNIVKRGSVLFTHNGISGPVVFQISEYVYHEFKNHDDVSININFLPEQTEESLFELLSLYNQKKEIKSFVRKLLPSRLADYIISASKINGSDKIAIISNKLKRLLISNIVNFKLFISNNFSIEKSVITGGGVDVNFINQRTMESTINPSIYFVGELLDAHGPTGGYNITIALATGSVAGGAISKG